MFHAIVFLPLIGAILAGIISLAGARARHPGGGVVPGAEDHAVDHGPHAAEPLPDHGAVIHESHDEPHDAGPPAAGSRLAEVITTGFLIIAALLSWFAFVSVGFQGNGTLTDLYKACDVVCEKKYGARGIKPPAT